MAFVWIRSWRCLHSIVSTQAAHGRSLGQWEWLRRSIRNKSSVWSLLRKFHKVAGSFATVKKIQHRRLVLYGMAAFLWEREKIPEEEVQRCLRLYEERVRAGSTERSLSTSSSTAATSSSWFSWFTRKPQESGNIEPVEKPPVVDEKELKRRQFIAQLTAIYADRSQEQMSKYPLVGMKRGVPVGYKLGSSVMKKTQASVASLVKHAAALTQATVSESKTSDFKPVCLSCCESVADLACLEVEVHHHHQLVEDWMPISLDTEPTNQFQASGYPLIGLQNRHSKVMEKLLQVNLPSLHNSLENFMHTFDQVVGVDSILDYSVVHQANSLLKSLFLRTLKMANKFIQEEHSLTNIGLYDNFNSPNSEQEAVNDRFLADWQVYLNEPSYVVYRKPYADTGLYQFKVIGSYNDITAKDFYEVQMDEETRMSWDLYLTKLKTVDSDPGSGCEVVHWVMKFPFPMSSREYVFVHKNWVSPQEDLIVTVNRSVTHPSVPESGSAVRVRDYYSEMVIKAHTLIEEPGMNYELTYFDDPQVRLPSSCVNWVANSAMPEFLRKVHSVALTRQNSRAPVALAT